MGKSAVPTKAPQAVGIEEVLAEIESYFTGDEQMQPGDVTARMLAERTRMSETTAVRRMRKIAAGGHFVMLKVRNGTNGGMWVLRKKCDSTP